YDALSDTHFVLEQMRICSIVSEMVEITAGRKSTSCTCEHDDIGMTVLRGEAKHLRQFIVHLATHCIERIGTIQCNGQQTAFARKKNSFVFWQNCIGICRHAWLLIWSNASRAPHDFN